MTNTAEAPAETAPTPACYTFPEWCAYHDANPRDVIHAGAAVDLANMDAYPLVPWEGMTATREHTEGRDYATVNVEEFYADELSPAGMLQFADMLEEAAAKVRALAGEWFA